MTSRRSRNKPTQIAIGSMSGFKTGTTASSNAFSASMIFSNHLRIHNCRVEYCRAVPENGSDFCKLHRCPTCPQHIDVCCNPNHRCALRFCESKPTAPSRYCDHHKCRYCNNSFQECPDHKCKVKGCSAYRTTPVNLYCERHTCDMLHCNQLKYHCPLHTCSTRCCTLNRVEGSLYCRIDKCPRVDCLLETQCPLHACQQPGCWHQKEEFTHDTRFCRYHKCLLCDDSKTSCRLHRCRQCKDAPVTQKFLSGGSAIPSDYCDECVCKVGGCLHPTLDCRSRIISKQYCHDHAPRCIDCGDIATYFSLDAKTFLFCHTHKACRVCRHKPRNSCKEICDNHHKMERAYPWFFNTPAQNISDVLSRRYCLFDLKGIFEKLYRRRHNVLHKILNVEFHGNNLQSLILQRVLDLPQELFVEFKAYMNLC